MKIVVLTTSFPRFEGDAAGGFVLDRVERLRARGLEVDVISPADFPHFGIAYGAGVVGNLRRRPLRLLALPAMLFFFVRAARRAARDADLVHAHWLPVGAIALLTGRPYVVELHGTDVEVARRAPRVFGPILRRARVTICVSHALAVDARRLGADDVRVIPNAVEVPERAGEEGDPPHVLFAGRLSAEKGILELTEAAKGLPLVVVGEGPLRSQVPGARGFVSRRELEALYDRAAVVACPSRREGFGLVCAEAMAHGKAVVASAVGGLLDLVVDGETGLLVEPGDVDALRASLERLLGDRELRDRLGAAARERIRRSFSWTAVLDDTLRAYNDALSA